jgi:hypothetical protein
LYGFAAGEEHDVHGLAATERVLSKADNVDIGVEPLVFEWSGMTLRI